MRPLLQDVVAGVTTGQLLCACVGSKARLEYTVYGDAINLSARLMVKAREGLGQVKPECPVQALSYMCSTAQDLRLLTQLALASRVEENFKRACVSSAEQQLTTFLWMPLPFRTIWKTESVQALKDCTAFCSYLILSQHSLNRCVRFCTGCLRLHHESAGSKSRNLLQAGPFAGTALPLLY